MLEQHGCSYFMFHNLTLIFRNKSYRTHLPYPSYPFLVTTCCRADYLPVQKQKLFHVVRNDIQTIFKYRALFLVLLTTMLVAETWEYQP